ncbi:hypothetical protein [Flavobacterium davisii]|uniref:Uncharacterized protein n=1 Tax=Flavobacterium columnare TaxID=996 RepID=A0A8G0KXA9_9FLAO|nr:hypothetical protein [Flavobacterium davisii]QYS89479.1 hypothetical protein JJC05_04155 [Flavobacterium davisii]
MIKKYIDTNGNEIAFDKIKEHANFKEVNIGDDFIETKKYDDNKLVCIEYEIENESVISRHNVFLAEITTFHYDKRILGGLKKENFKTYIKGSLNSFGEIEYIDNNAVYIKTNFVENNNSMVQKFFYKSGALLYAFEYDTNGKIDNIFDFSIGEYVKDINSIKEVNLDLYKGSSSFL